MLALFRQACGKCKQQAAFACRGACRGQLREPKGDTKMGCGEQFGQRLACRIARIGRTRPKLVGPLPTGRERGNEKTRKARTASGRVPSAHCRTEHWYPDIQRCCRCLLPFCLLHAIGPVCRVLLVGALGFSWSGFAWVPGRIGRFLFVLSFESHDSIIRLVGEARISYALYRPVSRCVSSGGHKMCKEAQRGTK